MGELQSGSYYGPTYVRKGVQHYGQLPLDPQKRQASLDYYAKQRSDAAAAKAAQANADKKAKEDAARLIREKQEQEKKMQADRDAKLIAGAKFGGKTGAQWQTAYADLLKNYGTAQKSLKITQQERDAFETDLSSERLKFSNYKDTYNKDARAAALASQKASMLTTRQEQLDSLRKLMQDESDAALSQARTISGSRISDLEKQLAAETNKYVNEQKARELLAGKNQEWSAKYDSLSKLSEQQKSNFALQMSEANTEFARQLQDELTKQRSAFDTQLTGFQSEADRRLTEQLQASKEDYTGRLARQQESYEGQLATQKEGYEARVGDLQGNLTDLQGQLGSTRTAFEDFRKASADTLAQERTSSAIAAAEMQKRLDALRVRAQTPQTVGSGPTKDAYGVQLMNKQAQSKRGLQSLRKEFDPKALLNLASAGSLGGI